MSIEASINALTAAIVAQTAALQASLGVVGTPPAGKPVVAAKADVKADTATPAKAADAAPAGVVDYEEVKTAFLKALKINRPATLALLEPFKIAGPKEAKPEQYADLLAAINKVTAA